MEVVTGAMGSLLPKLGELLKEEYKLQKGVREQVESLGRELESMHAALRKVAEVPRDQLDEQVKLWARDVRELSYDLEDVVDTFLVCVEDGREATNQHKLKRLLEKMGNLFSKGKTRRQIADAIKDINKQIQAVANRRGRYTVNSIVAKPAATSTIDPRLFAMYKNAAQLVGVDGPRDALIKMLSEGDDESKKKMKIVSVVGFGGLGKTTLAKAVYDKLKAGFDCDAFVPVGQNPDMKKVFKDILIGLDKQKYTNFNMTVLDERQLIDELREFLENKRYFIVIDDIWDKKSWEIIRCALADSNRGSRVVATTRISKVATNAGDVYKLQPLSRDNSEKLFCTRIFDCEGKCPHSESTEVYDKILKKCGGVPLAIITIASLLASKPWEDWSEVYNSIGFGHGDNEDVENTRKILSFSYYDLPSHLRTCLLYLSVFPEDYFIYKNVLIRMWIAEGFIHEEQGIGLLEVGEIYFNELINRSMIQPVETHKDGYLFGCRVHDMVLDLVRSLSRDENFVTILDNEQRTFPQSNKARRLALQPRKEEHSPQADMGMQYVRSFIATLCHASVISTSFRVLRVLAIEQCDFMEGYNSLEHLGNLLHLRYLGLGGTPVHELPKEIGDLKFLQTLDLVGTGIEELPSSVGLLTQLVFLHADRNTRVPDWIGNLTSLQGLSIWPAADRSTRFVKELGNLRELRVLITKIDVVDESMERALVESVGNLHRIQFVIITGKSLEKGATWESGFVSPGQLRYLDLECLHFSRLPGWINSSHLLNLCFLHVEVDVVQEQDMETLGRLPQLRGIELLSRHTPVVSMAIGGDKQLFDMLRFFTMHGVLVRFVHGECSMAPMPSLEGLEFTVNVRFMKDADLGLDKLGLECLPSLQKVTADIYCKYAHAGEVEEAEAALSHIAAVHPNRPTLRTIRKFEGHMLSSDQDQVRLKTEDKDDTAFTRFSVKYFSDVLSSLSSHQKKLIDDYGFGSLLKFSECYVPHKFAKWIATRVNVRSCDIIGSNRVIPLNKEAVHMVLGLPIGGQEFNSVNGSGKSFVLSKFQKTSMPPIKFFGDKIINKEELSDDDLFTCFMIVSLSCFLCPNSSLYPSPKYLCIFEDLPSLKTYDWSKYIFDWLMLHIRKFSKSNTLGGCIYFLTVYYLDFLDFGPHTIAAGLPRIKVWKDKMIQMYSDFDKIKDRKFGLRPVKEFSSTCYNLTDYNKSNTSVCFNSSQTSFRAKLDSRFGDLLPTDVKDGICNLLDLHCGDEAHRSDSRFEILLIDVLALLSEASPKNFDGHRDNPEVGAQHFSKSDDVIQCQNSEVQSDNNISFHSKNDSKVGERNRNIPEGQNSIGTENTKSHISAQCKQNLRNATCNLRDSPVITSPDRNCNESFLSLDDSLKEMFPKMNNCDVDLVMNKLRKQDQSFCTPQCSNPKIFDGCNTSLPKAALVSANKRVRPRLPGLNNRDGTLHMWDESRLRFKLLDFDDDKLNHESYDTFANKENEIVPDSVSPSPFVSYSQRLCNKVYDKQLPESMERISQTQVTDPREDDVQVISSQSKKETNLQKAVECFLVKKGSKESKDRPVIVETDSPEVQILGERNFSEKCNELCDMTNQIYNKNLISESNVQSCENVDDTTPEDKFLAAVRNASGSSTGGKEPIHGPRRVIMPSKISSSPYVTARRRFAVTKEETSHYVAICRLANSTWKDSDALDIGKVHCTFKSLGDSLTVGGELSNFVLAVFCRYLFMNNHPQLSKKHYFFSSVGEELLKNHACTNFSTVLRCFQGASKAKILPACDMLFFPTCFDQHWFLFIVDIKDSMFVFLDSFYDEHSDYQINVKTRMIANFMRVWNDCEYANKNFHKYNILYPPAPRQKNTFDCGFFVMKFMELWNPRVILPNEFSQADIPNIRIQYANRLFFDPSNIVLKSECKDLVINFSGLRVDCSSPARRI